MAQSLPKSQLHDIPLSVVDHGDTLRDSDKLHTKSNSLRRFFKMPHKKGSASEQMPESPSELQLETADYDEVDQETGLERKKVQSGGLQRRFHLRLGGMNKYANEAAMDASDKSDKHAPATSGSNSSTGKPSLKGSISSYWNTVFKRHHLSHSKGDASVPPEELPKEQLETQQQLVNEKGDAEKEHNDSGNDEERGEEEGDEGDADDDDDEELNNERELLEEVHTLPYSEDIPL